MSEESGKDDLKIPQVSDSSKQGDDEGLSTDAFSPIPPMEPRRHGGVELMYEQMLKKDPEYQERKRREEEEYRQMQERVRIEKNSFLTTRAAQVDRLIALGFHTELGMTKEQYRASIPELTHQLEEFSGRFDRQIIVDPRIPIERQLQLMHIRVDTDIEDMQYRGEAEINFFPLQPGVEFPEKPYVLWVNNGGKNYQKKPANMEIYERGLTISEGLSYIRETPLYENEHGQTVLLLAHTPPLQINQFRITQSHFEGVIMFERENIYPYLPQTCARPVIASSAPT